jgi:tRNA(Phe) wybutosine-synthesizing methylase Tyw3
VSHQEIPIKVTAWVDEGIAPLVAALNEHPAVVTLDSCRAMVTGTGTFSSRTAEIAAQLPYSARS